MKFLSKEHGFIFLELLLTIIIIEIGVLGIAEIFIYALTAYHDSRLSLIALELLRSEMEKLETKSYFEICPEKNIELDKGILFDLDVKNVDTNGDKITDYKVLTGKVFWEDFFERERSYLLVTFKTR